MGPDPRFDRAIEPGWQVFSFVDRNRLGDDRIRPQPRIGYEERAFHSKFLVGICQFAYAPGAETNGCRPTSIAVQISAVALRCRHIMFLRW